MLPFPCPMKWGGTAGLTSLTQQTKSYSTTKKADHRQLFLWLYSMLFPASSSHLTALQALPIDTAPYCLLRGGNAATSKAMEAKQLAVYQLQTEGLRFPKHARFLLKSTEQLYYLTVNCCVLYPSNQALLSHPNSCVFGGSRCNRC